MRIGAEPVGCRHAPPFRPVEASSWRRELAAAWDAALAVRRSSLLGPVTGNPVVVGSSALEAAAGFSRPDSALGFVRV